MKLHKLFVIAGLLLLPVFGQTSQPIAAGKAEILYDTYGVPHIFAADRESMFYAHGWAQMQNQAEASTILPQRTRTRSARSTRSCCP